MSKFALLLSLLLLATPCLAEDSKSKSPDASNAAPTEKSGAGRERARHQHVQGKVAVLAISSLSDKQKAQINGIYDGDKAQFEALGKQIRELREAQWEKVKAALTPDQITELEAKGKQEHQARRAHEGKREGRHEGKGHGPKSEQPAEDEADHSSDIK